MGKSNVSSMRKKIEISTIGFTKHFGANRKIANKAADKLQKSIISLEYLKFI